MLTNGLLGVWHLRPGGGWYDPRGNHHPDAAGVVSERPARPDGEEGYPLPPSPLRPGGDFAAAARVRVESAEPSGVLIARDGYPLSREWCLQLIGGRAVWRVWSLPGDRGETSVSSAPLPPGVCVVAGEFKGGRLGLGVNGVGPSPAGHEGGVLDAGAPLTLGGRATPPADPLAGAVLERAWLWGRALTAAEHAELAAGWDYEPPGPAPEPGPQPPPSPPPPPQPPAPPLPPTLESLVAAFAGRIAAEAEARGAILQRLASALSLSYERLKAEVNRCALDFGGEVSPGGDDDTPAGSALVQDAARQAALVAELVGLVAAQVGRVNELHSRAVAEALRRGATGEQLEPLREATAGLAVVAQALEGLRPPPPGGVVET